MQLDVDNEPYLSKQYFIKLLRGFFESVVRTKTKFTSVLSQIRQTESSAYEATVQYAQVGSKMEDESCSVHYEILPIFRNQKLLIDRIGAEFSGVIKYDYSTRRPNA